MKEYGMFTKDGEIIYRIKCENVMDATKQFSFLKQMDAVTLLEIYTIKQIIN